MEILDSIKTLKVLYVEDDDITREMASRMISKYFDNVIVASDGSIGLEKFKDESPDLIITDLSMPEMSGFEMISNIRETGSDIPIIVTTAYRSETESLQDVNAIVFKPVNKKLLLKAIEEIFS
jgi:CheY-like chemotaxis protein